MPTSTPVFSVAVTPFTGAGVSPGAAAPSLASLSPAVIAQINAVTQAVSQIRDTRVPPPAEGQPPLMPLGTIAQVGVFRSRPGSIQPDAAALFSRWIAPPFITDRGDGLPTIPDSSTGQKPVIGYARLRARAFPSLPAALQVLAGDTQTAAAGTALPVRPAVRVLDAAGNPIQSAMVAFTIASGGALPGGATTEQVLTDASGVARMTGWTLGPTAGSNSATARAGALTINFTATGT